MLQHVHLHGLRMREQHVADVTANLGLRLKRVFYQVALQLGRGVKDTAAQLTLVYVALLHHVTSHVHLDLVLRAEGLLALDTLEQKTKEKLVKEES